MPIARQVELIDNYKFMKAGLDGIPYEKIFVSNFKRKQGPNRDTNRLP